MEGDIEDVSLHMYNCFWQRTGRTKVNTVAFKSKHSFTVMATKLVFHMKGGQGKSSYSRNSSNTRMVMLMAKPTVDESILKVYRSLSPECLVIADLGCCTGPNTLLLVSEIMDTIQEECQRQNRSPPSFSALLNDIHANDFNTLYGSLPDFHQMLEERKGSMCGEYFISGVPGSFYGRLFPKSSVHFVHSAYALMCLSQVPDGLATEDGEPLNKGNISIAKTSPASVFEAYHDQFKKDFTLFLKCRAAEVVNGGRMVLTVLGREKSNDPQNTWEFVGLKLHDMVEEGLIEKTKLDTFNVPEYFPTADQMKQEIEAEGSFTIEKLEVFKTDWDAYLKTADCKLTKEERAMSMANYMRAVGEPILSSQFGEEVMDDLFGRFEKDVYGYMEAETC